jgi:hypothetical protein
VLGGEEADVLARIERYGLTPANMPAELDSARALLADHAGSPSQ